MAAIYKDLYQFSNYIQAIDLSFHQYLLLADEPVLVHTGSIQCAEALVPELKAVLGEKQLKYIFISHFESDECGGLSLMLKHFPEALPICSAETGSQLRGFGITNEAVVKKPGEKLISGEFEFEFIGYPSEMHLWEGLVFMENKRGIFFSSDLMFRFGKANGEVIEGNWLAEIKNIPPVFIPDPERLALLQWNLSQFNPAFVATGHGPCLKL